MVRQVVVTVENEAWWEYLTEVQMRVNATLELIHQVQANTKVSGLYSGHSPALGGASKHREETWGMLVQVHPYFYIPVIIWK